jgi:PDZ domain-containing protein
VTLDPAAPAPEPTLRRQLVGPALILASLLVLLVLAISPAPYVVERPGPVYDTLGTTEVDGEKMPVIGIDGAPTYPTDGRLDLLTVYLDGTRENPIDWFQVIGAWLDPRREVVPIDLIYPEGQTEQQSDEENELAMRASQQAATAAALAELDIEVDSIVTVLQVTDGDPAEGVLEAGDEILTIDGAPITSDAELRAAIADAGVGTALDLGIRRDGTERTVTVTTEARSASDDSPIIGILPGAMFDFPFDVAIHLQDVGGPSAGMMFALGIYDTLTPGALTGGEHIAGTGTIDTDGEVGPIGGIRQKLFGARDAGADWFLAPEANCSEVTGHVPDGLRVFAVSNLDDALDVVRAIGEGSSTDSFPGCG